MIAKREGDENKKIQSIEKITLKSTPTKGIDTKSFNGKSLLL